MLGNHNSFKSLNIFDFHEHFPNLTIEGGDIIVFDKDRICIGISERTPLESITKIALTYDKQIIKSIPYQEYDVKMDCIVSEKETIFTS